MLFRSERRGGRRWEFDLELGDAGEMAATRSIDRIASELGIPTRSAAQIKTALIEVLINAAEHSLSPDGRAQVTVEAEDSALVVRVSNRGVRLADRIPAERSAEERRGWGLSLIRTLMDDVTIEPVDDGTSIVMRKRWPVEPSDSATDRPVL